MSLRIREDGRLGVISCSKTKLTHAAAARDLYCSPYFRLCRDYIRYRSGCGERYVILSAKYGVVKPHEVLEPYDLALHDMGETQRREWALRVQQQLLDEYGRDTIYTVVAGGSYRAALYGMSMVEDCIAHWTEQRRWRGMRKPQMGIGVIKKHLKWELDRLPCIDRSTKVGRQP